MGRRVVEDSIRDAEKSHRAPDVASRIAEKRGWQEPKGSDPITMKNGHITKKVGIKDSLPHSPDKMAKMGLTSVLPPAKVKDVEAFQAFVQELSTPDFAVNYPTWSAMQEHFGVDERTLRSWMLSKEAADAIDASVRHKAKMRMPSILESVALRAEMTGDPHAAKWVSEQAEMNRKAGGHKSGMEISLRLIAEQRATADTKVIDVEAIRESERPKLP